MSSSSTGSHRPSRRSWCAPTPRFKRDPTETTTKNNISPKPLSPLPKPPRCSTCSTMPRLADPCRRPRSHRHPPASHRSRPPPPTRSSPPPRRWPRRRSRRRRARTRPCRVPQSPPPGASPRRPGRARPRRPGRRAPSEGPRTSSRGSTLAASSSRGAMSRAR